MESELPDEYDRSPETFHFLLRLLPSQEAIGTVRVYPLKHPDTPTDTGTQKEDAHGSAAAYPTFALGRLCVLEQYRKYKFGHKLVQQAHSFIRNRLLASRAHARDSSSESNEILGEFIIHAQVQVKGFYLKNGYTPFGDIFDEDGMDHQLMRYWILE
ncbi:acyl-CoA N-acyltransferase [Cantharellus anzutake]|uniref:acyl-CoA N-acyltransferase n=1 Tax=Cantharellus anzutake TaxID=1750568 RepID=UPI0019068D88|nr:acyl-CoA N-acyltransferase [Cantharellus anzutake]KAF8324339.1 acyl-CoA N-acyltransferase [Cantharellus anzutake]